MTTRIFLLLILSLTAGGVAAASSTTPQTSGPPGVAGLVEQANQAAEVGNKSALAEINKQVSQDMAAMPAWVDERVAAASQYTDDQADAVQAAQEMSSEAQQDLQAGKIGDAISAQESALFIAKETFGPDHWLTVSAMRDLGYIYAQAGDPQQAESNLQQALSGAEKLLGDEHPEALKIAGVLGQLYDAVGVPDQASMMREMVVAGLADSLGPMHSYTVSARMDLVRGYETTGQIKDALADAMDLCGDIKRTYGHFHPTYINCLQLLASVQSTAGALADAESTYRQVSALMGKTVEGVDSDVLDNLSQLAETYRQQGDYRESKRLLSGIIQLALQTGHVNESYIARSYLGRVFNDEGDYANAQQVTEEVMNYGAGHWQDSPLQFYNTLVELGAIYQARGKLPDAEATLEEAYRDLNGAFGPDHPSTLVAMNDLGQLYEKIGLYDKAEPLLKEAVARLEANYGPTHPDTLRARNNLALLYESQGNFREAEPLYVESLNQMRQVHGDDYTDTVSVENNLAYLYMLEQNYDKSAAMFQEVLDSWTKMFGPKHQNTLKAMNNLARVYTRMGKLGEAEPLFKQALASRRETLGENHLDTIRSMIDLGGLYLKQGKLDDAKALLTDALGRAEKVLSNQHPYTFDALNLLSKTEAAMGNLQAAVDLAEKGFHRRSRFLDRMLWTTGENAREGYIRLARPEFDYYMQLLTQLDPHVAGKMVIDASLQRKGLLLKVTSEIQQIASMSKDPALKATAAKLDAARKQLARLTLSGPTEETLGHHAEALYKLEQQVNELQGELGRASVRFRTAIADVSVDDLAASMKDNTSLVDFLTYEAGGKDKLLAGVAVKKDGKVTWDLVKYADRKSVDDAVVNYRTYIQDDLADDTEIREAGRDANDTIWAPVQHVLQGARVVYLVPDGILNILPFNALVGKNDKYLIQTHDLRILTSSRDLLPTHFELAKGSYVIMAGPDYDATGIAPIAQLDKAKIRRSTELQLGIRGAGGGLRGLSFSPLPGAEKEGEIIKQQVVQKNAPNTEYFGKAAQEEVLSDLDRPPEILHMATHGFFLKASNELRKRLLKVQRGTDEFVPPPGDNPLLRAGLAFAGVNTNAPYLGDIDTNNDGVLTALEVLGLDLSGTQLVVLSACETGLGEIHEGEGVYGLRRAFQEAGVAEVISSLWEVSDAGTQALMTDFYNKLLAGEPARQALRETQLAMLDSPRWGYPYIWSAFMITGSYESAGYRVTQ